MGFFSSRGPESGEKGEGKLKRAMSRSRILKHTLTFYQPKAKDAPQEPVPEKVSHAGLGPRRSTLPEIVVRRGARGSIAREGWANLPPELLRQVRSRLGPQDAKMARLICGIWCHRMASDTFDLSPKYMGALPEGWSSSFPSLINLDLSGVGAGNPCQQLQPSCVGLGIELKRLPKLRSVRLPPSCRDRDLADCADGLSYVTSLDLGGCSHLTDAGVATVLRRTAGPRELKSLSLEGCALITDSTIEAISLSPSCSNSLTALKLSGCRGVTDKAAKYIANGLRFLASLELCGCPNISDAGLKRLGSITSLERLSVRGCDALTDSGLQALQSLRSLKILDASFCSKISGTGVLDIKQKARGSSPKQHPLQLVSLDLSSCRVTDAEAHLVSQLSSLLSLSLHDCHVSSAGLASISKLTSLTEIDIAENRLVTSEGLTGLGSCTNLKKLILTGCNQIADSGILGALEKLRGLTVLHLGGCREITDSSMAAIAAQTGLEDLNLGGCTALTDDGLRALSRLSRLHTLVLRGCRGVTDLSMYEVQGLSSLSSLNVKGCPFITLKGILMLEKNMPKLRTISDI